MNEIIENISCLRLWHHYEDVGEVRVYPYKFINEYLPSRYKAVAWIPQSTGSQTWCMFEFISKEEREEWEDSLPNVLKKALDRGLIEEALKFGWFIRDYNGFVTYDKI